MLGMFINRRVLSLKNYDFYNKLRYTMVMNRQVAINKQMAMPYKYYCYYSSQKNQNMLKKYEKIKQSQKNKQQLQIANTQKNKQQTNELIAEQNKKQLDRDNNKIQNYRIRCQGCNTMLQSKDKTKYGYITDKVLQQTINQNVAQINQSYGQKLKKSKDAKILDFMHEVEKETGIKIFNEKNNKLENLDNVQVLVKLQQKIQQYEQQEQLANRRSKVRKQLLCYRCFSLKHHNRLPQQYDNNEEFTTDSTQFILNKMLNRHKGHTEPVQYLYIIDAFDLLGTFQQWLLRRLIHQNLHATLIINKIDIINKQYLHEPALHAYVKQKLTKYLSNIYKTEKEVKQKLQQFKIFYISCNSRDGMKKLKEHIEGSNNNLQLVGYPNTGKTSLLNILAKIKKSISKVPGTTIKITQHQYSKNIKRKVYDMPGLFSQNLLYNLIQKPSIKMMLTWHKRIAPGLLTNSAIIYGGKIQIADTRIIVFGQGGACASSNKWFLEHYKQFWKGLPSPNQLKIKKHQIQLQFTNGRANDLEIAGYGFIGFRLCIPNIKKTTRKLILYLPQKIEFAFRPTVLSVNDSIFHNKSGLTKKFMLQRLTIVEKNNKKKTHKENKIQNSQTAQLQTQQSKSTIEQQKAQQSKQN